MWFWFATNFHPLPIVSPTLRFCVDYLVNHYNCAIIFLAVDTYASVKGGKMKRKLIGLCFSTWPILYVYINCVASVGISVYEIIMRGMWHNMHNATFPWVPVSDIINGLCPTFLRILLHTMPLTAISDQSVLLNKRLSTSILHPVHSHFIELENEVQKLQQSLSWWWYHDETSGFLTLVLFLQSQLPHWGERKWNLGPESGLSLARAANTPARLDLLLPFPNS